MNDSVAMIASRLTPEQRKFLLSLPNTGEQHWPDGMPSETLKGLRGFGQSGLVAGRYIHSGAYMALTPLGREVRAILQEKQNG